MMKTQVINDAVSYHKDELKMTASEWYGKFMNFINNNDCWFGIPMIEMMKCAVALSKVQDENYTDMYSELPEMIDRRLSDIIGDIYRESARYYLNLFNKSMKDKTNQ